jgi:hypothetical protein
VNIEVIMIRCNWTAIVFNVPTNMNYFYWLPVGSYKQEHIEMILLPHKYLIYYLKNGRPFSSLAQESTFLALLTTSKSKLSRKHNGYCLPLFWPFKPTWPVQTQRPKCLHTQTPKEDLTLCFMVPVSDSASVQPEFLAHLLGLIL